MRAVEVTGSVDDKGQLSLDQPIEVTTPTRVRVIVLFPEFQDQIEEIDPDDTSVEEIKASLRRALQEAKAGQRIPLSQMWEELMLNESASVQIDLAPEYKRNLQNLSRNTETFVLIPKQ